MNSGKSPKEDRGNPKEDTHPDPPKGRERKQMPNDH